VEIVATGFDWSFRSGVALSKPVHQHRGNGEELLMIQSRQRRDDWIINSFLVYRQAALGIILFREPFSLGFALGTVMILGSGVYLGLRTGRSVIGADGDSISAGR
jgi:hypothetical protein